MRGFNIEWMLAKVNVMNNDINGISWISEIKLHTKLGPENITMTRSKILTDLIDFENVFLLFSRIVSEHVAFVLFK